MCADFCVAVSVRLLCDNTQGVTTLTFEKEGSDWNGGALLLRGDAHRWFIPTRSPFLIEIMFSLAERLMRHKVSRTPFYK